MTLSPPSPEANEAFAQGVAAQGKGDLPAAIKHWQRALDLSPTLAPALYNLAVAKALRNDGTSAAELYEKLLALDPTHKDALFNLANLRARQKNPSEAATLFRRLTKAYPTFSSGWINYAKLLSDQGILSKAEPLLRKTLSLDPTNVIAHWNLAHLLLRQKRWEEGWREYEWRLRFPNWFKPPLSAPSWTPNVPARRVLLWNDQGMGDALQFLRFPRLLAEKGIEVTVLIQDALKTIASTAPGVAKVIGPNDPMPEVDAHAPLLSLPHRLGLSCPQAAGTPPYLKSEKTMSLPRTPGHRAVGLIWAGNKKFSNDSARSAPLSALKPLFAVQGIDWFSFQFGDARGEIETAGLSPRLRDLTPQLHDFADTAAAFNALDLVISVDTAPAHLAGALGIPCWLMLSSHPDARWQDDETANAWYPSIRPFRQRRQGDWQSLTHTLVKAL